jgi:glycine cleavage system T protein (aminomethyltransferase)
MPQFDPALRKSPLDAWHRANAGRMGGIAGWDMPAEYTAASDEHLAVRTRAGLLDISDLGQVEVAGRDALAAVQRVTCNDASRLKVGQIQRSALTTPAGTLVDAIAVHRLGNSHFLFVVDPAGAGRDVAWITDQVKTFGDVAVLDTSARYAGLSLQGPLAEDVLQGVTSLVLGDLEPGEFSYGEVAGVRVTIARSGCSGEDGFELLAPPQGALNLWTGILREGETDGVVPVGSDAHDTLRLEAGIRLWGADIDQTMTVFEAGLDELVAWDKGEFVGRPALVEQKADGMTRRPIGFEMADPAIARPGCDVYLNGAGAGTVTSGAKTPFLQKAIGLASVRAARIDPGTILEVDVQGHRARARVVTLPFYRRPER